MSRTLRPALAASLFVLLAVPALAQRTTGGISGTVKDSTGAMLPGVTVSVSGPAIVGTQTATTNEQGFYRFINLPPGDYQLVFTLQGFTSVTRRGLRVPVGGTIEGDAALAVRQMQESIDVVGDSSVLDTTSNEVGANFDREWVENAPLRRYSFFDLVASAPGSVQAGDGSARTHMYGSSYDENSFQVDGVDITDNYFNEALAEPNVDAIAEVEVLSLGAPAEYGNLTGAVYNIVTRQGSNEFHGDLNLFFQSDGLTSNNTDGIVNPDGSFLNACSEGDGRCPWKRDRYTDITAQLGGPIVKDKLWFFASYQNQRDYYWDAGFAYTDLLRTNERTDRYFFKLNWQINPKHKLVGTFHHDEQDDDLGPAALGAADTTAASRRGKTPTPGLGYTGEHLRLIEATAPAALDAALRRAPAQTVARPGTFAAQADKRATLELALDHLLAQAPAAPEAIPLPAAGAPFGSLRVDTAKCTMCLSCVGACPESALADNPDRPQLRFIEKNCVQCGLCATTCPEDAITLQPRLWLADSGKARKAARVLHEVEPYRCVRCGKPFGTLRAIESMIAKVGSHAAFAGDDAQRLRMCGDCRVVDIFSHPNEVKITDL